MSLKESDGGAKMNDNERSCYKCKGFKMLPKFYTNVRVTISKKGEEQLKNNIILRYLVNSIAEKREGK